MDPGFDLLLILLRRARHSIALAVAISALAPAAAHAVTFNVTTTADQNDVGACFPGDPSCSLREAINRGNALPSDDVVMVPIGTFVLGRTGADETGGLGDLDVVANGKLTIQGAGARDSRIFANRIDRVLDVHQNAKLDVSGMTLTGGETTGVGGGMRIDGNANNSPTATVTVDKSTISGNVAARGAGVSTGNEASLTLTNSTVSGNFATESGGGIRNDAGGGAATLALTSSTVSGNSQTAAQDATPLLFGGGGIVSTGAVTLRNATIASNTAKVHGGGIQPFAGTVDAKNTIVSGNTAALAAEANCSAPITSSGFNLELGTTCGFAQSSDLNGDPRLGPLGDNGGPTNTQFPGAGSPALDSAEAPPACLTPDQRGISRPQGSGCDRGAVEAESTDVSIAMTDSPDPVQNGDVITYRITVRNLGTAPARGVVVVDRLPSSLSPGTSAAGCSDTQTEVCSIGSIPVGGAVTIAIQAHTKSAGTVSNPAFAFTATRDPNLPNNYANQTTTVKLRSGPCANLKVGTAGADTINGTPKGDLLRGLGGNDTMSGGADADCLEGGNGNDQLRGGSGNDKLSGGMNNDDLTGGSGKDVLNGDKGDDTIHANDGTRDTVDCGPGSHDKAFVDSQDSVKNCETVVRGN